MVRVKTREEPTPADHAAADSARYIHLRDEVKEREGEMKKIKERLMAFLDKEGEEDDQGSLWFDLPTDVEGYTAMKRERRVSRGVAADKAMALLKKKGLEKRCYRKVPTLDQDEVMKAVAEGLVSDEELAEIFPDKVTWALVPAR